MEFVKKQPSGNFLLFVLRNFIECVTTVQTTNNIKFIRGAMDHRGNKKFFHPDGRESAKRCAIAPTSRLDFLKALVKRGRACCNSVASRKADGMNTHQSGTRPHMEPTPRRVDGKAVYGPAVVH